MAFMVNRGEISQHSCNDIYTGKPVVFGGKPVIFPLYKKKNFHTDKPGMEARPIFAKRLRRLNSHNSETVLEIHPFYTIRYIRYFTFFFVGKFGFLTVH